MKTLPMVMMTQVAELMQQNIVPKCCWKTYDIKVQIDIVTRGTASPVCGVMLDGHAIECKPIAVCEFRKPSRKFGFCLAAHHFNLLEIGHWNILIAFLLTCDSLDDPLTF